jgi:hypothetical protein
MLRALMVSGMAALMLATSSCAVPYEQTSVRASYRSPGAAMDVSYFYDSLAPYGHWIQYSSYGWCWTPYDVDADWRPYSNGYWVYTDFGWSWASNEPWGWAAYHYGRWLFDADYGWVWVPDTEWGPAWVAWRYSDDWIGWAPLPPQASWDVSVGLRFESSDRIPSPQWCFVQRQHFVDSNLRFQVVSVARNPTLFPRTRDVTRFEVREGHPVNHGIDVAIVERMTGRRIQPMKIVDVDSPQRGRGVSLGAGAVGFFRPQIRPAVPGTAPVEAQRGEPSFAPMEFERQQAEQRRRLEQSLAQERARLERDHQQEIQSQPRGADAEEIRRRHAAEQQAFEEHATQQRQVLEQRIQKRIMNPGRAKNSDKRPNGDKDQDKGKGREKGGRGEG